MTSPLSPSTVSGDKGNTNERAESDSGRVCVEWDGGKGAEKWRHLSPLIFVLPLSFPAEWWDAKERVIKGKINIGGRKEGGGRWECASLHPSSSMFCARSHSLVPCGEEDISTRQI